MEIKVVGKEETGLTRYFSLELEVDDGKTIHQINASLVENYESNSDSSVYSVDMVEFETSTSGLSTSDAEGITKEVEAHILNNASEIIGDEISS